MRNIIAKLNGIDVPVEVEDSVVDEIRNAAVDNFVGELISAYVEKLEATVFTADELSDDEYGILEQQVKDSLPTEYGYVSDYGYMAAKIASGEIYNTVRDTYQEILNERARYYTVEGTIELPVTFVVKAKSKEDAKWFLENLDGRELEDYTEWCDATLETADVIDDGSKDYNGYFGDAFDATE